MLKAKIAAALALLANGVAVAQQPAAAPPLMLFFDWGKPDIRSDDQAILDQAVAAWKSKPGARIILTGNTDRSGSAAFNMRASRKRAEMVGRELEKRGVPPASIAIVALGEANLLVPTEDGVREVQNRRVDINILTDN